MKLLRHGPVGHEKPGLLDASGQLRDLSAIVPDIAGAVLLPEGLARLAAIDPASLPAVPGSPRLGPCVAGTGKFICHRGLQQLTVFQRLDGASPSFSDFR
jgi:hypothetical protein